MGGNPQSQHEELFLNSSVGDESPIIQPLRVGRRDSPSPGGASTGHQQNAAAAASFQSLPYPDDRSRPHQMSSSSSNGSIPPSLSSGPARTFSPAESIKTSSSAQSNVPSSLRPTGSGTPRPFEYPAALRPQVKPAATLAERRGTVPKPLPDSIGSDSPDKEPFSRKFQRAPTAPPIGALPDVNLLHAGYHQQYWPPPQGSAQSKPAVNSSINRISSTASTSTTRAQRGSPPPPPETPVVGPGQQPDIDARFAAATGIAGTYTLAQSAAAQKRAEQYAGQQPRIQQPAQRPWTPTEEPGTQPHGPPTVYQGPGVVTSNNQAINPHLTQSIAATTTRTSQPPQSSTIPNNALEQDLERMRISSSPPPAYSSVPGAAASQGFQNEKQRLAASIAQSAPTTAHPATMVPATTAVTTAVTTAAATAAVPATVALQGHPAFANDPRQQPADQSPQSATQQGQPALQQTQFNSSPAPSAMPPTSPPPLPEGWIAHLDPNSGQYYYIHLPTQSTQWEFPKGPTPLNLNETPLSPVGSVYSSHPLASPGISGFSKPLASPGIPLTPGYESLQSPVMTGFTGPPPSSGVDLYKVAPTNGVYFGPYLRYTNMDLERGIWLGSILLVTDASQSPTIHIHQSVDLSPNPRQLKAVGISVHQRWTFYKYDIDLRMEESGPAKWTYAITSHLGCTRYEFLVAGRHETNWRFIATSGNDFSLNASANERSRLGGVGFMWKDIMQKHNEIGGFHAQLCLGGQIYADRMWKEIPSLKQWLAMSGKETRKNAPWTAAHEEDVSHAYFHYYTSHFDQPYLRESFAQIPYICQIDDHDM